MNETTLKRKSQLALLRFGTAIARVTLILTVPGCAPALSNAGATLGTSSQAYALGDESGCPCEACDTGIKLAFAFGPPPFGGAGGGGGGRGLPAPRGGQGGQPAPSGNGGSPPVNGARTSGAGAGPAQLRAQPADETPTSAKESREVFANGLDQLRADKTYATLLPRGPECPLPKAMRQAIEQHSIWKLRETLGREPHLTFRISHYLERDAYERMLASPQPEHFLGEAVQARFLGGLLAFVFPNATIETLTEQKTASMRTPTDAATGEAHEAGKGRIIRLDIADDAEDHAPGSRLRPRNLIRLAEKDGRLQMGLLKPINMNSGSVSNRKARAMLGIGLSRDVVHVSSVSAIEPAGESLIDVIEKERKPSIIFYTPGYQLRTQSEEATTRMVLRLRLRFLRNGYRTVLLSTATPKDLEARQVVVINDLRGVMPYLNGASKMNFIIGPINPFEGLNAGTPTVLVKTSEMENTYNVLFWQAAIANVALGTGGARVVDSWQQALAASRELESALKTTQLVPPYLAKMPTGKSLTPLERFLDHLERTLMLPE